MEINDPVPAVTRTFEFNTQKQFVPYFDCWVGQWAIHEPSARALQEMFSRFDLVAHLQSDSVSDAISEADNYQMTIIDGIAIINICGPMMKQVPSMGSGTSTLLARRLVNQAVADSKVKGIMLKIESPGGTVAGTKELADCVRSAGSKKPTKAYINDLGASAAYWLASQCQSIEANEMALVGSIGTFCVVSDSSKAAEKAGVTVHVLRAGSMKGFDTPGTEITDEGLASIQVIVNGLNTFFLDAVSEGRKMEIAQVAAIADGRVHLAAKAKEMGLIDAVSDFETAFRSFSESVSPGSSSPAMPVTRNEGDLHVEATATKPATATELKAKFSQAGSDWILSCVEKNLSMLEAQQSYMDLLQARMEDAARKQAKPGVKPNKLRIKAEDMPKDEEDPACTDDSDEDDVVASWHAAFNSELKACGGNRQKALMNANRKNPGLRERFVKASQRR